MSIVCEISHFCRRLANWEKNKVKHQANWFNSFKGGHFDWEHYQKVLEAKQKLKTNTP